MYTIGLTGNIGCGKSTVLCMLQALGARVIDADKLAHQVMEPGTPVWHGIVETFGQAILAPDGRIDRPALGRIVFSAPKALRRLEAIVHPAVDEEIRAQIEAATEPLVVIEAIKLIESGLHRNLNAVWIVTCSREQQMERLVHQRGMSYETAIQRINAQAPIEEKLPLANVVIDNSGTVEETWQQVQLALEGILSAASLVGSVPPQCADEVTDTLSAMVVVSEG
jgi:dephospho-CoA kinase